MFYFLDIAMHKDYSLSVAYSFSKSLNTTKGEYTMTVTAIILVTMIIESALLTCKFKYNL